MEGIILLNEITVYDTGWGFNSTALAVLIIGVIMLGLAIIFAYLAYLDVNELTGLFSLFCGVCLVVGLWACSEAKEIPATTQYEVYLTEDINMEDFAQKYNIIKQDGVIFTIEEKEGP